MAQKVKYDENSNGYVTNREMKRRKKPQKFKGLLYDFTFKVNIERDNKIITKEKAVTATSLELAVKKLHSDDYELISQTRHY